MLLKLVILLFSTSLIGCQTLSYQEPVIGDRARVRFATNTNSISILYGYDDASCSTNEQEWMRLRTGVLVNSSPKLLNIPFNKHSKNAAKEVYVQAGKELHFLYSGESGGAVAVTAEYMYLFALKTCGNSFSYKFEKNKDYEVFFNWDESNRLGCKTTISEIDINSSNEIEVIKSFDVYDLDQNSSCYESLIKTRFY